MKRQLLMLAMAAIVIVRVDAQELNCTKDETAEKCFQRFGAEWAQREVAKTNTGIANVASPSQSTAKDFLSKLAAALIVPMSGDGSRPLTIDLNRGMPGGHRFKLQAILARPELSSHVKARLANNSAAMTAVKDSLSELDDVTVSGTLEPSTVRYGRSIAPHLKEYEAMMMAMARVNTQEPMSMAQAAAAAGVAQRFAMLLDNQPQLYGSLLYRTRRSVAGPDERSARVTYEMGFHNLNSFHDKHSECAERIVPATCSADLVAFVDEDMAAAASQADRLSFAVEYRQSNGLSVVLPQHGVAFDASSAHSFVYSLAYGRNRMVSQNGRLDLAVNYEDTTVSEVTDRVLTEALTEAPKAVRDRFVASATYTYKINDQMAMPVSLIYANHASFLGDVDRRLNAHIGITFKMQ